MGYQQLSILDDIDGLKPLNNTKYTYKSPSLIATSYELSFTQQRIIALACKKMQPIYIEKRMTPNNLTKVLGAMQFRLIEISVSEFKDEYDIAGKGIYEYLSKEVDDLYEAGFYYYDEHSKLSKRRWVSSCDYDGKNGVISITFNIDILLDLLIFKGKYVALFFDLSQDIRSKYAYRIYEILKSKAYLGIYKMTVDEFKFMLAIQNKYDNFAELNRNIIKPNLNIINKISDIDVVFKPIRSGRIITLLQFNITKKTNIEFLADDDFKNKIPSAFKEVSDALLKYNVKLSSKDTQNLFDTAMEITKEKYRDTDPVAYLIEKIKVLDNYIKNNDVISPIGFLLDAMTREFSNSNSISKQLNKKGFNNFEGRPEAKDEKHMRSVEHRLLGWDDNESEEEIVVDVEDNNSVASNLLKEMQK
jgi:plasmid replication initiation protein